MLLDSNIVIGYLNGDPSIRERLHTWRENGRVLFITHITVIEVLSQPTLHTEEIPEIEEFLNDFIIIPLDLNISLRAAEFRRKHSLQTPDAIIVASARVNNLPLVTRDKKLRLLPGIAFAEI